MGKRVLKRYNILSPKLPIGFVCNINEPEVSEPAQTRRLQRFLENFGPKVSAGFNIYVDTFDLTFLVEIINRYGMNKYLRLGLAHPIPGEENSHIPIDSIKSVVARLYTFTPLLERYGISIGPDCGFPMCAFDDAFIGWLYKMSKGHFEFGCGPVLDISPDMQVWPCFPLNAFHRKSVFEFKSLSEMYHFYQDKFNAIRNELPGIYESCETCNYRIRGVCSGGCVAHSLNAFRNEASIRLPEVYEWA